MLPTFTALFISALFTLILIKYQFLHEKFSIDSDLTGVQKFHKTPTPRIGGISIALGIVAACLFRLLQDPSTGIPLVLLAFCALPALFAGLAEDLTKKVGALTRLLATFISAVLACYLLNVSINSIGISWIDPIFAIPSISILFTCLTVAGLANSYNIIDGFNGLASMIAIITLAAIGYVAFRVHDPLIILFALVMIGSIAGFFIWNYPQGLIFLGDGGAYFIGFWVGILSIMLVSRNPEISPWFACLINIYPIFETIFSIWRKKVIKKISPGVPDGVHLHMLIYGRLARWLRADNPRKGFLANARTSPYLWGLSCLATVPAMLFWSNTMVLACCSFLFCIIYVSLYRSLVRFNTPRWLK
jgi:UDP-N-acetylmuramyl pentapeptide phosphotransferase/UDP-N-acetylglucosamine-1-phosphate transferase